MNLRQIHFKFHQYRQMVAISTLISHTVVRPEWPVAAEFFIFFHQKGKVEYSLFAVISPYVADSK